VNPIPAQAATEINMQQTANEVTTLAQCGRGSSGPFEYYVLKPDFDGYPNECYGDDGEPRVCSVENMRSWLKKAEEAEEAGKPKRYWRDAAGYMEVEDDLDGWRYLFPINDFETLQGFVDSVQEILRDLELT
jgi:hypothetical protein